jgi:hypothetical protein
LENFLNKTIKWMLIVIAVGFVINVARHTMKASKEVDARIALAQSCTRQAQSSAGIPLGLINTVCNCVTDKTAMALGPDGIIRLASTTASAAESDSKALMDSMLICMSQLMPPKR